MPKHILRFLAAALLGIVQAAFVSALPDAWASVSLPVILIVTYVMAFRDRNAFLAALGAGLTMDALSSLPTGSHTVTLLVVTAATIFLFTRIFSHRSWSGTVGLNVAAYTLSNVMLAVFGAIRASFNGIEHVWIPTASGFQAFFGSLLMHTVAVIVLLVLMGLARRALTRRFILLR